MTSFKDFLKQYKVEKGSEFTHTSLGEPKGSYYISGDIQENFNALYATALENGENLYLTEKHRDISPVLIDLDFRQNTADRLYTDDMIVKFLNALKSQIIEYTDCQEMTFYVLEKGIEARPSKSGGYKDGLHIVVPDVVTKPDIQFIIRDNIIKNCMQKVFGSTFTNNYADIYDEAVIKKNNWFLYGSKKPDEEYAWAVTKVLDKDLNEVDCDQTDAELVEVLSIRNKFDASKVKADKAEEVKQWKLDNDKPKNNNDDNTTTTRHIPSDCETIVKLVKMLNPTRADDYHQWISVGACLYNINTDLLGLWEEFSKQSKKYTETGDYSCERKWRSFGSSRNKTTEGTLRYWAKQDNPEAYAELQKNDIHNLIYLSKNETHTDIAKVVHHMFKDMFVCCFIKDKPYWYEFKNHRWELTPNGVSLKKRLSSDVFKVYSAAAAYYHTKATTTDSDPEQKVFAEIGKKLCGIGMKLKNAAFKNSIMMECTEHFQVSQHDFYDKLDERKELIGFTNGVYDLDMGYFRDGLPDDMISMSTNCRFIPKTEYDKKYINRLKHFTSSVFENETMEAYFLDKIAGSVHGYKPEANILFFTGHGSNGKSVCNILCSVAFGDYFYAPDVKIFTGKRTNNSSASPDIVKTKGKRLVWASEPEEGDKFQVSTLKNWSGGEKVQGRELFKDTTEFKTQFQIAISMNHLTGLSATDGGIERRMRIVKFPLKFCKDPLPNTNQRQVDESISKEFENDPLFGEHFMSMLIERYVERVHNKPISVPDEVMQVSKEYIEDNDTIKKFLGDNVEITGLDTDMVLSTELYSVFRCSEYYTAGNDPKWFTKKMSDAGYPSMRQNSRKLPNHTKQVYKGFKLKEAECEIESDDELN